MAAQVTVIIPNYNGRQLLLNCIRSLEKQTCTDFKLLVVDNGSTDGSTQLNSAVLDMEIVPLSCNTGFCGAVNTGLKRTKTPYAILLNNDTEVHPAFVEALLKSARGHKRLFSVSACMIDYRDRTKVDNAGDLYTVFGWAVARGKGKNRKKFNRPCSVFSGCGGAVLYRMEALRQTGLMDENHFAYLEDVDLGYRARIYGMYSRYEPKAVVYHVGSATTGSRYNEKKVFLAARNSVYVIYKNMPFLQLLLNMPFILSGIFIKFLFFFRKGFAKEYAKGIAAGFKGAQHCRKTVVSPRNIINYVVIEMELFVNCFRILLGK